MDAMLDFFEASAVTNESPLHERHPFVQVFNTLSTTRSQALAVVPILAAKPATQCPMTTGACMLLSRPPVRRATQQAFIPIQRIAFNVLETW